MALMKQVSVDGQDVEISDVSDVALLNLIRFVDADLVAVSLSEGKPLASHRPAPLSESEPYRRLRLRQLTGKRKALLLEARRRKLEVE